MNHSVVQELNGPIQGMINTIWHLVKVEEVKK